SMRRLRAGGLLAATPTQSAWPIVKWLRGGWNRLYISSILSTKRRVIIGPNMPGKSVWGRWDRTLLKVLRSLASYGRDAGDECLPMVSAPLFSLRSAVLRPVPRFP